MAFWYTRDMKHEGPVYGVGDHWHGLGVFVDTFDNDAKRDNPSIRAMLNDGTKSYDHDHDGIGGSLGAGCGPVDLRNTQEPFKLRVMYVDGVLSVMYDLAAGAGDYGAYEEPKWIPCIRIPATLPSGYHIGLSGATGDLSDAHNVRSVLTYSYGEASVEYQNEQDEIFQQLAEKHANQEIEAQKAAEAKKSADDAAAQKTQGQDTQSSHTEALRKELEELKAKLAAHNTQQNNAQAQTQAQAQATTTTDQAATLAAQAAQFAAHQAAQEAAQQAANAAAQQAAQAAQAAQATHTQTQQNTYSDTSRTILSADDVNVMRNKLADLERAFSKQAELLASLTSTAETMSNRLASVQNTVNAISSSASLSTTNNRQGGSELSTVLHEAKNEIITTKRLVESEGQASRGAISSVTQHIGPIKASVDQLTNSVNNLRSIVVNNNQGGNQQGGQQYAMQEESSWTFWILFFLGEILLLGGFAYWMRRRPKKERYMH